MNKRIFRIILLAVTAVAGIVFLCLDKEPDQTDLSWQEGSIQVSEVSDFVSVSSEPETGIWVYISGCVAHAGVYFLPEGSRLFELVELAGGICDDAAQGSINLAQPVQDGQHYYIPSSSEAVPEFIAGQPAQDLKININTASAEELMTLPGIGQSRAQAIIDYRENKHFDRIEDIMNVSGIKDHSFQKIKDKITI